MNENGDKKVIGQIGKEMFIVDIGGGMVQSVVSGVAGPIVDGQRFFKFNGGYIAEVTDDEGAAEALRVLP